MLLIDDADKNDLNSSPRARTDAIYLGGESGELFSIPYDYCLRPDGLKDSRCSTKAPVFADGAALMWTTTFGTLDATPPSAIDPTAPITLSLVDRTTSGATLAILDSRERHGDDRPADERGGGGLRRWEVRHDRSAGAVHAGRGRDRLDQRLGALPREPHAEGAPAFRRNAGERRRSRSSRPSTRPGRRRSRSRRPGR